MKNIFVSVARFAILLFIAVLLLHPAPALALNGDIYYELAKIVMKDPAPTADFTLTDYSASASWLNAPAKANHAVDCFYVYPTGPDAPIDGHVNIPITEQSNYLNAQKYYQQQATVFTPSCNVYAPYYQQVDMQTLTDISLWKVKNKLIPGVKNAYAEVKAAFNYYLEHHNNGRPFILAGHSQGSLMLNLLLMDVIATNEEARKKMVAAYAIGWPFAQSFFSDYPQLAFAEGADDTGVVISYNSCTDAAASVDMMGGGLVINPISWRRDDTQAPAADNPGSVFFYSPDITAAHEYKNFADAKADSARGVNIVSSIASGDSRLSPTSFPAGVYHTDDYALYYRGLQENVKARIAAYMRAHESSGGCNAMALSWLAALGLALAALKHRR